MLRRAFVVGGTGTVGSAVVRELVRREIPTTYTHFRSEAVLEGATAVRVDLRDPVSAQAAFEAQPFDIAIYCAGVSAGLSLAEIDLAMWNEAVAVNTTGPFLLCQVVAKRAKPCDVVLVGGVDRAQSLPLPAHFAATQGALPTLAMAVAHEVGRVGIRVNVVALGPLEGGISQGLAARRRKDYETFSALRRPGKPEEAARVIAWLAVENAFIQGKVISANGGI